MGHPRTTPEKSMRTCHSLEILAEYIGHGNVIRLVDAMGGQAIKIPVNPRGKAYESLLAVLGEAQTLNLIRDFAGEAFYMPKDTADTLEQRKKAVLALRNEGLNYNQIAARFTYTERYSERWIRKLCEGAA